MTVLTQAPFAAMENMNMDETTREKRNPYTPEVISRLTQNWFSNDKGGMLLLTNDPRATAEDAPYTGIQFGLDNFMAMLAEFDRMISTAPRNILNEIIDLIEKGNGFRIGDIDAISVAVSERQFKAWKAALASIPTPTAGRAEALKEAAKIADDMRIKHSSPTGNEYTCGAWDQAVRIAGKIRVLSSAPTHQAVTVDDARIELAIKAYDEAVQAFDPNIYNLKDWLAAVRRKAVTAALTAAFPQHREE